LAHFMLSSIVKTIEFWVSRGGIDVQKDNLCFCRSDFMSIFTAAGDSEQKRCKIYKKSSHSDNCMYFVFDEYCY